VTKGCSQPIQIPHIDDLAMSALVRSQAKICLCTRYSVVIGDWEFRNWSGGRVLPGGVRSGPDRDKTAYLLLTLWHPRLLMVLPDQLTGCGCLPGWAHAGGRLEAAAARMAGPACVMNPPSA